MIKHRHDVLIQRPLADVFRYMDDVTREHEWQPNIVEAYKEPSGDTAVGTLKRYVSLFLGKRIENVYRTKVFEVNRHAVYETTRDSALQARAELRWEAEGGATRVTMSFQGKVGGVLRFVPKGILDATYKKELSASLLLLKEKLESEG